MIALNLHSAYKSRMRFCQVNVPETWNELSREQLIAVAKVLLTEQNPYKRDVLLVKALVDVRRFWFQKMNPETMLDELIPMVQFIKNETELTEQLLPYIPFNRQKLYGPKSHLQNLRFGEFDAAERALYEFSKDQTSAVALWRFVAILYRTPKLHYDRVKDAEGDCRSDYNENLVEYYAQILKEQQPMELAIAVMIWYKGCRNYILNRFDEVFSGENKSDEVESPAYFGLMRKIAERGIYGTMKEVEQLYIYNVMAELCETIKDNEAMKEQMENNDE